MAMDLKPSTSPRVSKPKRTKFHVKLRFYFIVYHQIHNAPNAMPYWMINASN